MDTKLEPIKFTVTRIADALIECEERIGQTLPELLKKEIEYNDYYYKFLLSAQAVDAGRREAQAYELIRQKPIFMEFKNLEYEYKILRSRKETLNRLANLITWGETK